MDGFFHNGTSWGTPAPAEPIGDACDWSEATPNTYLAGCTQGCKQFDTLAEAKAACEQDLGCGGITIEGQGRPQLRAGTTLIHHPGEQSYLLRNPLQCKDVSPDPTWLMRGRAAYQGIARADPNAIWAYQGWALYVAGWRFPTAQALSYFRGFSEAAPPGHFLLIDMVGHIFFLKIK